MSGKEVIRIMLSTERMRKHMISLPSALNQATTDMTAARSLSEDAISIRARKWLPHQVGAKVQPLVTPSLSQGVQPFNKILVE